MLFGATCLISAPALAEDDAQLWSTAAVAGQLSDRVSAQGELSYRIREGDDQVLTRATVEWKLSRAVTLGGGMAFTQSGSTSEYRPFQQVTLTTGPFAFRTRLEERLFDGADRAQLRLRQQAQYSLPIAEGTKAALSGELLYIARSQTTGGKTRMDQYRLKGAVTQRLSPRLEVTGGYLYISSPVLNAPDRTSHVGQLTLTFRP